MKTVSLERAISRFVKLKKKSQNHVPNCLELLIQRGVTRITNKRCGAFFPNDSFHITQLYRKTNQYHHQKQYYMF